MKRLTQIFQALLGVVALIFTAIIAFGRLAWRTIRNWWKNRPKWLKRSLVATIIALPIAFISFVAYVLYEDKYGRESWYDMKLSENVSLHSFADQRWRVYNHSTEKYTTKKIGWLATPSDGDTLAVYALANRRGYIDVNSGNIVIDAETNDYQMAWVFSEGLAAVMKDGKVGFINAKNEIVIPFQYDYSRIIKDSGIGYLFHRGYCPMTNAEGKMGIINLGGDWVVAPIYDKIWWHPSSEYHIFVEDGEYGVLGNPLECVYAAEYNYLSIDSKHKRFTLVRDGRMWQEDENGEIVIPFMYNSAYHISYPCGYKEDGEIDYKLSDYLKYEVGNYYGIVNRKTGEPITRAIYSSINMLSQDLFEVQEYDSYDCYLLDAKGNVVPKR